jgi:hypothetical protein
VLWPSLFGPQPGRGHRLYLTDIGHLCLALPAHISAYIFFAPHINFFLYYLPQQLCQNQLTVVLNHMNLRMPSYNWIWDHLEVDTDVLWLSYSYWKQRQVNLAEERRGVRQCSDILKYYTGVSLETVLEVHSRNRLKTKFRWTWSPCPSIWKYT